jgi:hypothetical protein
MPYSGEKYAIAAGPVSCVSANQRRPDRYSRRSSLTCLSLAWKSWSAASSEILDGVAAHVAPRRRVDRLEQAHGGLVP